MNCRDIEPLLHAERDGLLTNQQQADLTAHVATCAACQQQRTQLNVAMETYLADVAQITVPDANKAWQDLQHRLTPPGTKSAKKRPLAPVVWFGTSLAAAAALTLVYFNPSPITSPAPASLITQTVAIAQADYVESGDPNATTMVFADQQSGWLVVWATDPKSPSKT